MEVRPATAADAEQIRQIYNEEVTSSTVTFDLRPRTLAEQLAWLEQRSGTHAAVVAVEGDVVLGFGSLSPYRDRPAYNTSVEDSVYVRRQHRGRGVGRVVLGELVATAKNHGFHTVIARIVGGHEASISLHAALGFDMVGTERQVGRKFGRWLDVVIMQLLVDGPDPDTAPGRPPVLGADTPAT
jgi:phosphinothricin acetyltransferase